MDSKNQASQMFKVDEEHLWITFIIWIVILILSGQIREWNKGKGNGVGLQTSSVLHTHTLLVQTHNMTTVKEMTEHVPSSLF